MKKVLASLLLLGGYAFAPNIFAGEGYTSAVTLQYVSVVSDHSSHKPGNLEIGVSGGFSLPSGVSCSTFYITTLGSVVNYDNMLKVLLAAHLNGRQVVLGITDDPKRNAFSGRCSLTFVNLQ